jgi:putative transposase
MGKTEEAKLQNRWLSVPIIAAITRLLCRELTLQNEYLRAENKILKSKIGRGFDFTDEDRRTLVDAALAMDKKLMRDIVTIVKPEIILAWQRRLERQKWDYSDRRQRNPGRPRIASDIEKLVCQMARENTWGYKRIQGELQKLGIKISKGGVANILRKNKLPPSPERRGLTWREFLSRHAEAFLCADLFTKEIWTFRGLTTVYVFFVIHLHTRKVLLAQSTFSSNSQWLKQQIRHVIWECEDKKMTPRFFLHDNDKCYSIDFDSMLKAFDIKAIKTPFQAPNANSHAERFILSIKNECLNHLLIFGLNRLQYVLDLYVEYFNSSRPHQGIDNRIPDNYGRAVRPRRDSNVSSFVCRNIIRKEFLGGLLKSYQRAA